MKFGVSTACLYPENVEDAFRYFAEQGAENIEIFLNTFSEMEEDFIEMLAKIAGEYSVCVTSLHPFTSTVEPMMLFGDYPRRYHDIMELYRRLFERMNRLGAKIFVIHGDKTVKPCPRERYFERYLSLYRAGREAGIIVAQENVERCSSKSVEFCSAMSHALGNECAFVLDIKQAVRAGESPLDFVNALGDKIRHIHISDHGRAGDCLPVGKGEFDFRKFFSLCREKGIDGSAVIELYRSGYSDPREIIESAGAVRKIWESL